MSSLLLSIFVLCLLLACCNHVVHGLQVKSSYSLSKRAVRLESWQQRAFWMSSLQHLPPHQTLVTALDMTSSDADNEAMPSTDSNTSLTESDEEKKTKGPVIFGYCLTDPQDLISIGLITVIAYNALDILFFYVGKLFNAANGAN